MSLPRYPSYKAIGSSCLGPVPAHWEVQPCRYFVEERADKNEGAANQSYLSLMANVGVIPYEEKGDVGNKKPEDLSKCKLVAKGDLVINSMNYGIGSFGLSAFDGVCSPVYIVLRPRLECVKARFALRVFENRAFQTYAQSFGNGILEHRAAINWDTLKGIRVGMPSLDEQEAILSFLDRETAKIDALIAEQEKLIALLAEKRQATISHAVTRGLNPDAPMKDSGVPWLGAVPAHWEVKQLRYVASVVRGASPRPAGDPQFFASEEEAGQNTPWVTVAEVTKDESMYLTEVSEFLTPLGVFHSQSFCAGTLIFTNSGATLGVPKILGIDGCANDGIVAFKNLDPNVDSEFLYYFLCTTTERLRTEMKQGGGQPNLNTGIVKDISFGLPPFPQQREIVDALRTKLNQFDALCTEAAAAVTLLNERRSALIAAAVTGQIDVRGAVAA